VRELDFRRRYGIIRTLLSTVLPIWQKHRSVKKLHRLSSNIFHIVTYFVLYNIAISSYCITFSSFIIDLTVTPPIPVVQIMNYLFLSVKNNTFEKFVLKYHFPIFIRNYIFFSHIAYKILLYLLLDQPIMCIMM
jgi:hypothetical protein